MVFGIRCLLMVLVMFFKEFFVGCFKLGVLLFVVSLMLFGKWMKVWSEEKDRGKE